MPFDFQTMRKAKWFFKEDLLHIQHGAVDRDYVNQKHNNSLANDLPAMSPEVIAKQKLSKCAEIQI